MHLREAQTGFRKLVVVAEMVKLSACITILAKTFTYKNVCNLVERQQLREFMTTKSISSNTVIQGNNRLLCYLSMAQK